MDAELRRRRRRAEELDTAPAWRLAVQEAVRGGDPRAAGEAALRAARLGDREVVDLLAGLEPADLSAFSLRIHGVRHEQDRLVALAWAASGLEVVASSGRRGGPVLRFGLHESAPARTWFSTPRRTRALAMDVDGSLALCLTDAEEEGTEVFLVPSAATELGPRLLHRRRDWTQALSLATTPEHVLVATRKAVRAFRRDDPDARPVVTVAGRPAALSPWGVVARLTSKKHPDSLLLGDPLQRAGRAVQPGGTLLSEVGVEDLRPWSDRDAEPLLGPAGRGAVSLLHFGYGSQRGWGLARWSPELGLRSWWPAGDCPLPYDENLAVSPSGRFAALLVWDQERGGRAAEVRLVDLERGQQRVFALEGLPSCLAWSPGGTALAVGTDQGTLAVLDANPGRELPPQPRAQEEADAAWLELRHQDRFWRARQTERTLTLHWGRLGSRGQTTEVVCEDAEQAQAELERRQRAKQRAGYRPHS